MALKVGKLNELEPQVFELEIEGRPITADTAISPAQLWERYRDLNKLLQGGVAEVNVSDTSISEIKVVDIDLFDMKQDEVVPAADDLDSTT